MGNVGQGRPRSTGELTEERKAIRFRLSELKRIKKMMDETGITFSAFAKRLIGIALDQYESGIPIDAIMSGDAPITQLQHREMDTNPELQALLKKHEKNTLSFLIAQPAYERFTTIAAAVGYPDPGQLAKDLVMAATVKGTDETRQFMFGEAQEQAMQTALEQDAAIEEEKTKPVKARKVA